MKTKQRLLLGVLLGGLIFSPLAHAESGDLSLEGIRPSQAPIVGQSVRLYATVRNNSGVDLLGTVKFFDETAGAFLGDDQPVSVLAGETDTVFVDWQADSRGDKVVTARVIPWDDDEDDAGNNKSSTTIYVDVDSDGDGTPDRQDVDDDNDGVNDDDDAFPLDASESADFDGDGQGDNADEDDDNDGVLDVADVFPTDPNETKDSDGDGVGDNSDAFPDDFDESVDADGDGLGANADPDDNNVGPEIDLNNTLIPGDDGEMIGWPSIQAGKPFLFDASYSKDVDGSIVKYEWDFGEGYIEGDEVMEYTYSDPGDYTLRLKVTDDKGEYRELEADFTVSPSWDFLLYLIPIPLIVFFGIGLFFFRRKALRKSSK